MESSTLLTCETKLAMVVLATAIATAVTESFIARKQNLAGEENKKCDREAIVYSRFWTMPNTVEDVSCCYKELFHTIVCRQKHSQMYLSLIV